MSALPVCRLDVEIKTETHDSRADDCAEEPAYNQRSSEGFVTCVALGLTIRNCPEPINSGASRAAYAAHVTC
jgi:hypothetical protein